MQTTYAMTANSVSVVIYPDGVQVSGITNSDDAYFTVHYSNDDIINAVSNYLGNYDDQKSEEGNWVTTANLVNGGLSVGWGGKDVLFKMAAGTDESIKALSYFKVVKVGSKALFGAQLVISGIQAGSAWVNSDGDPFTNDGNKWGVTGKAALDITMAAIGTFGGPIGWAIAGTYFLIDATTNLNKWGRPRNNKKIKLFLKENSL